MKERSFGSLGWGIASFSFLHPPWSGRVRRLRPVRIEALLEPLPAIGIVILQRGRFRGMRSDALRIARLEHEGERARELDRLQLTVTGMIEGLAIGAMRQHAIVQGHAARHETFGPGVIDAVDQ